MSNVSKTYYCADLFCGAGGLTTGLIQAAQEQGIALKTIAVNHWTMAIRTHSINHPDVEHLCNDLSEVEPKEAIPGGHLHLLCAGIECTHFSYARGGKPMSNQRRSSAWTVLRWCRELFVDNLFLENVREFQKWGPLYPPDYEIVKLRDRPIKMYEGVYYRWFLEELRALGYHIETRIVNAADYGDATTRKRFFLQANRTGKPLRWPAATHGTHLPHRAAKEIIDWSLKGESIFRRKKPLADATMRRILAGMRKFCGLPFIVPNFSEAPGQAPRTHSVEAPLPAVTGHGAGALVQPFLVKYYEGSDACSLDAPLPTVTANYEHLGLCQPFLIGVGGPEGAAQPVSVDAPLGTILAENHRALIQPFIVNTAHSTEESGDARRCYSVERSLPTIVGQQEFALCEPYLVSFHGGDDGDRRTHPLTEPLPTQDTSNRFGLATPFLINYYGHGDSLSVADPLDTVTGRDRFALIQPELFPQNAPAPQLPAYYLDILFRMLQPHELAAAHSFPEDYIFFGKREDRVKQIGNSIPVRLVRAHCASILCGLESA